jgi:DNA transformation protein
MSVSAGFREHALDLLSLAGHVTARAMFGGVGLYAGGTMFALLDDDDLFLKTDEECRPAFVAAGCRAWVYPSRNGPMVTSYYRPPDDAHDNAETMLPWAKLAIAAARRIQAAKAAATRPRSKPPAAKKRRGR